MSSYYKVLFILALFIPVKLIAEEKSEYKFVLVLQSTNKKYKIKNLDLPLKFRRRIYKLYFTETKNSKNTTLYRLNLGFFKNEKEAINAADILRKKYSHLWVKTTAKADKKILQQWLALKNKKPVSLKKTLRKVKNSESIMNKAKEFMAAGNYRKAIGLFTKIISDKSSKYYKDALEFLGVAREKNGQLIHARAEYRIYLKKFPTGKDSERVRQRLLALNTVLLRPKSKLKKTKDKLSRWQHFGSFSQFYRSDTTTQTDVLNSTEIESSAATMSSVFNYISRKRSQWLHMKSQLTASHLYYFDNPLKKERGRINIAFIDFASPNKDKSIRIGRQSQNRAGAPGRMDGAWIEYRLNPAFKVNLVAGYPVNTTLSNSLQENKPFVGLSCDISSEDKSSTYTFYTIEQKVDSIINRQAIGAELRYRKGNQNHFAMLDYDSYFDKLNTFYFVGNWRYKNNSSIVTTLNYRNSPILSTTNALQGQGDLTITSLLGSLTEDEIKQVALDRTSRYSSASISYYIKINENWDFNTDFTTAKLDSTPTTPANAPLVEILGQESSGNEFYYNLQFISRNIFGYEETSIYQLSVADTQSYKKVRYIVSTSVKSDKKWRYRPRITFEDRLSSSGVKTERWIPSLRVDYKPSRHFKWEFDISKGTSTEISTVVNPIEIRRDDLNFSLGFIWDF